MGNLDRYVDSRSGKGLWGGRLGIIGGGLLLLALAGWAARDFIPTLATTRVVATAVVHVLHDASEADLDRAFLEARKSTRAEATLERGNDTSAHGTSYLSVTADTPELAKAGLSALIASMQAAFPSSERNLLVSPNNGTLPAPNEMSERISLGVRITVVVLMLAAQLLMVVGAHFQGTGRMGLFATIAVPFLLLLFPTSSSGLRKAGASIFEYTDFKFLLVLLAVTPVSVIVSLWLTRDSKRGSSRGKRR